MNDEQFLQYSRDLLQRFAEELDVQTRDVPDTDPLRELASAFLVLSQADAGLYEQGPALTARLFTTYPELAPTFPRQLLWFFGGDCLHFMADEEILQHQQLEEMRLAAASRGETLDMATARAKLLNLQ